MGCSLSDEEIKAIYKKIEPVEKDKDKDKKVSFISLQVKKALGLDGY